MLPYRDIFVQHGLGEDIIKPALACAFLGPSVESLRRLGSNAFIYRGWLPPLGTAALLIAAWALVRRRWLILPVGAAALLTRCELTDRHFFGLFAIACVAGSYHSKHAGALRIASGALGGLAALYSLEVGVYVLGASLAALLLEATFGLPPAERYRAACRRAAGFLGGLAAVYAPFLVWCSWRGILKDFARNLYIQLFLRGEIFVAGEYPRLRWISEGSIGDKIYLLAQAALYYSIPLTYLLGLLWIGMRGRTIRRDVWAPLLLTSLLGSFFWQSVLARPDAWHVAYTIPAFLLFAAVAADALLDSPGARTPRLAAALLLGSTVLMLAITGEGGTIGRVGFGREDSQLPDVLKRSGAQLVSTNIARVGRVRIATWQADYLKLLLNEIHRLSGEQDTVWDLSDQGLIYFLSERRSPTRFHFAAYYGTSQRLQERVVAEVAGRQTLPACVIRPQAAQQIQDLISQFVNRHYVQEARIGGLEIMRRADIPHRKNPR